MIASDIDAEHERLGYRLGWRFMMGPKQNLQTSHIALITLNPSGNEDEPDTPKWSQEAGSAYAIESWRGKSSGDENLQKQIRGMCNELKVNPHEVFSAVFVPFRSPRWNDLTRKTEAIAFAQTLWRWALPQSPARLFICIGKKIVGPEIIAILGATHERSFYAQWGNQKIERFRTGDDKIIINLPHLSQFKLFSRQSSRLAFIDAVNG